MKAKLFFAVSMIALSVTGVSAQSKMVYGGFSFPHGYFEEDDYSKNIFFGGKEGGAATGFNVGFKYFQPFSVPNLNWYVSAELFYNGLTSDLKDDIEDNIGTNDIDLKYPSYFNIPVLAGVQYSVAELNKDISLWVEGGLGVNCRLISSLKIEEENSGEGEAEISFDNDFLFAFQFGGGIIINKNISVGLAYYNLGSDKIRGVSKVDNNDDKKIKSSKELSTSTIALRIGYIF